jgi:hypothetical protein
MSSQPPDRREFLKTSLTTAAVAWTAARGTRAAADAPPPQTARTPRIKFAAIGLNHGHINGQTDAVIHGGGELVSFFAKEPDLVEPYAKRYPNAKLARSEK